MSSTFHVKGSVKKCKILEKGSEKRLVCCPAVYVLCVWCTIGKW
jgi:hypothetical protein